MGRATRLTFAVATLAAAVAVVLAGCGGSTEPGTDLAFVSTRDGDYAIFGLAADGSGQARLTDEKGDPSTRAGLFFQVEPDFSPDGTRIAFASGRENSFDIYVMDADGTGTERLTSTGANDQQPSWSPDGAKIAFSRSSDGGHVFVMDVDGTGARRLTDDRASESDPAWSPDGEWIAYSRREPGTEIVEIWLARPDGSERRQLTTLGAESFSSAWAPDGQRLAFAANRGGSRFDIYTIGVDGTELRRAVRSGEDAFEPAWSPDGEILAFARGGAIVTVDAAGNEVQLTDPADNDSSPVWNPRPPVGDEG